jgi:hypothetical protein
LRDHCHVPFVELPELVVAAPLLVLRHHCRDHFALHFQAEGFLLIEPFIVFGVVAVASSVRNVRALSVIPL